MATIKTALALYDGITGPMQSITHAMSIVINSFEALQQKSDVKLDAIDVSALQKAREEIAKAEVAFDSISNMQAAPKVETAGVERLGRSIGAMENNIKRNESAQRSFNSSLRDGGADADGLMNKLKSAAATLGGLVGTKKVLEISDKMASAEARLTLIVDDGGSVTELEQKIMGVAQSSRANYLDVANSVAKLGLLAGDAFSGNDEIIRFAELMNKSLVVAGASAQEQSAAIYQLNQAMASGRLQGDEYRSIIENAPLLADAIEDYMRNVQGAEGSMKDWSAQGLLTAEVIKGALFYAAKEIERKFSDMPMTWESVFSRAGDIALIMLRPLIDGINWLANNIQIIGPVVLALGTAFAVFQIAAHWTNIAKVATGAYNAVVNLLAIGFGVLRGSTAAASAATMTYNSVLLASPITWIILIIIILIGVLYAGVAAFNKFTGSAVSGTGIIFGALTAALAFIGNIFIALWNLVVDVFVLIYNLIAEVANFVGNVFTDPIGAVGRLFFGLADTVLGVLQALAAAIDAVFGSNLAGSVQGWRDNLGGWVDETFGKGTEIMAKMNADDLKLNRFEYGAAYDVGYNFGKGIDDKIGGMLNFENSISTGGYDTGSNGVPAIDEIGSGVNDIAGNTAAMSDNLDIAEENLAYMRDIAEREAINRFTTAEITIHQTNENHISKDTDLDGVMNAWASSFAEKLENSPEGVHE